MASQLLLAFRSLLLVAPLVLTAGAARAELFYTDSGGGFGTIDASGNKTPIGTGLQLPPDDVNPDIMLILAPDRTLYGLNVHARTSSAFDNTWGRIDPTTGTFTAI